MNNSIIGIYGASGFGKEVLPLVRQHLSQNNLEAEIIFLDDNPTLDQLSGIPVCNYAQLKQTSKNILGVVIAIANSQVRELISKKLELDNIKQVNISAYNNVLLDDINMGEGSLLCPFVTLTSNIRIGKSFHANIYSYVAHDCIIEDYVTFAPKVMCNGNVHIKKHAYIGTGAIIKQGTPEEPRIIGEGSIVGMGAVVTKDVAPYTVVVGNPAKVLKTIKP